MMSGQVGQKEIFKLRKNKLKLKRKSQLVFAIEFLKARQNVIKRLRFIFLGLICVQMEIFFYLQLNPQKRYSC